MTTAAHRGKLRLASSDAGGANLLDNRQPDRGLALKVDNLSHRYGDLSVLENIDLTIEPGSVAVLVGPSGCGKSTLLNIIGGLLKPTDGKVTYSGEIAPDCINPFTYVFQDFALLPWRSVGGNVSLVLEDSRLSARERAQRIDEVLTLTGLNEFKDAYPAQLSGGMRQRVGISRALSVRPACLLMDEPLSALDAQSRLLLLEEFAQIIDRARTTTVYVTHNLNEAVRLGHQIVVLSRRPGRVKEVIRIDRPITERRATDADMIEIEAHVWDLIRNEAAIADKELGNAGDS